MTDENSTGFHVVIIGGGFGGLYTAKGLSHASIQVTLIDKRNFHLFQPLLYQVAAGELSPGDIAAPLRAVFHRNRNIRVMMDEVTDVAPEEHEVVLKNSRIKYDALVVATGAGPFYFGKDQWSKFAPGLKTVEDAVAIRHLILQSFEQAEVERDLQKRKELLTFVIIGGGPTGVELAGAIGELARTTLKDDFRNINPPDAVILLIEAGDRILGTFKAELSKKAERSLAKLGVTVMTQTSVTNITADGVKLQSGSQLTEIKSKNILWTAGVKASSFGKILADRCRLQLGRTGRVPVQDDLRVEGFPDINFRQPLFKGFAE
ncbi:NAD(P)/FAD-dependent oxidoreductase [bacterium]|nr:NAD(P)/FAD-dependent oxidoreductase [bacterium]